MQRQQNLFPTLVRGNRTNSGTVFCPVPRMRGVNTIRTSVTPVTVLLGKRFLDSGIRHHICCDPLRLLGRGLPRLRRGALLGGNQGAGRGWAWELLDWRLGRLWG